LLDLEVFHTKTTKDTKAAHGSIVLSISLWRACKYAVTQRAIYFSVICASRCSARHSVVIRWSFALRSLLFPTAAKWYAKFKNGNFIHGESGTDPRKSALPQRRDPRHQRAIYFSVICASLCSARHSVVIRWSFSLRSLLFPTAAKWYAKFKNEKFIQGESGTDPRKSALPLSRDPRHQRAIYF